MQTTVNTLTKLATRYMDIMDVEVDYSTYQIGLNIQESIRNKQSLISVFEKMPTWDSERLRFHVDVKYKEKVSGGMVMHCLSDLGGVSHIPVIRELAWLVPTQSLANNEVMDVEGGTLIARYYSGKVSIRDGMKLTKVVRRILDEDIKNNPEKYELEVVAYNVFGDTTKVKLRKKVEKAYSELCSALKQCEVTKRVYISVAYSDFIRMSLGNTWESCHYFGYERGVDNCSRQGCLSYANDGISFLTYIESQSNSDELTSRMHSMCMGKTIMFGRVYGDNDWDKEELTGQLVAEIASAIGDTFTSEGPRRIWELIASCHYRERGEHYPDYDSHDQVGFEFSDTEITQKDDAGYYTIGSIGLCINCGNEIHTDDPEHIICDHCNCDYYCDRCDEHHHEDQMILTYSESERTCSIHASMCENCKDYEYNERMTITQDGMICENCLDNYAVCDECGEYHDKTDITITSNGDMCQDCLDELYFQCDECGEYVHHSNVKMHDNCEYCDECFDSIASSEPLPF